MNEKLQKLSVMVIYQYGEPRNIGISRTTTALQTAVVWSRVRNQAIKSHM